MKINYDEEMIKELLSLDYRPKVLLHSCCGPCSTACIDRLKEYADITVIYYNPNIEPLEEYKKRKSEQIKFLKIANIPMIEADYDNDNFHKCVDFLKFEPEGGKRCSVCFAMRLKYTAMKAKELNFDYFATTLTVSPHKNSQVINKLGYNVGKVVGIKYLYADFKKRDGYKKSIEFSKTYDLYRQDYCGCLYGKGEGYEE